MPSFFSKKPRRLAILGIDSTPFSFVQGQIAQGKLPNLAKLAQQGALARMNSVYPWVSSVAWTCLSTGSNPGKHNIFGFIDRDPATYKTFVPTARQMRQPTLWEILSQAGKQVVSMNVPTSYPPKAVNGVLISGFLAPSLEKAVYPASLLPTLRQLDYRIDVDPGIAYRSLDQMMGEIEAVLERRVTAIDYLMKNQPWDFFMAVIMETDRLHHFFWKWMEQNHAVYAPFFHRVYARVDEALGQVARQLDDDTTLMIMSDHGACAIKQEVYYNRFLADSGWLKYRVGGAKELAEIDPASVAYSLDPGRIFIRVKGREKDGVVAPGAEYEKLRDEIANAAEALRDPATGDKLVLKAYRREELYNGPYIESAADLILAPANGYDPKGALFKETLLRQDPVMVGMHTFDDATLYVRGRKLNRQEFSVMDVMPTVLTLMGLPAPSGLDGRSLVEN